jgi:hypothetical protein
VKLSLRQIFTVSLSEVIIIIIIIIILQYTPGPQRGFLCEDFVTEFYNVTNFRHTVKHRLSDLMREDREGILGRKSR